MIVWFCEIPYQSITEKLTNWLTTDQLARYRHFSRPIRASQYLYSRIFYKRVLIALGAVNHNNDFPIGTPHPPIITKQGRFYTSLTHSNQYFALSLSAYPNAVDTEVMIERKFAQLANCMGNIQMALSIRESHQPALFFYRFWCRRECQIKMGENSQSGYAFTHKLINSYPQPVMLCCLHKNDEKVEIRHIHHILSDPLGLKKVNE